MVRRKVLRYSRARDQRRGDPERHDREAGVAQAPPVEAETPRLDQHEQQQGGCRFGKPVDRDVDEQLRPVLEIRRQRQEQHLARRLVDRIAQRGVEDSRHGRCPQRAENEDDEGRRAEAKRQQQQRGGESERPMQTAGERHLHDEPGDGNIDGHFGEERGDRRRLQPAEGHVQLLLDDRRPSGGEADHQRGDGQVLRGAKQPERFAPADAFAFDLAGTGGRIVRRNDLQHDHDAGRQHDGADEKQIHADVFDDQGRDARAERAAQAGAAADEAEQPLRLPRVVDVVGQRPELADEDDAEHLAEEVEGGADPVRTGLEQRPEDDEQDDDARLGERDDQPPRHASHAARVGVHHSANDDAAGELDVRQVVGAEAGDELRPRQRLEDVVGRHRQQRVDEHQQCDPTFAGAQRDERVERASQQRHHQVRRIASRTTLSPSPFAVSSCAAGSGASCSTSRRRSGNDTPASAKIRVVDS